MPKVSVVTAIDTSTFPSSAPPSPLSDSSPASVTVPTEVDRVRFTTSISAAERPENSALKVPVAESRTRRTSDSACRWSIVVTSTATRLPVSTNNSRTFSAERSWYTRYPDHPQAAARIATSTTPAIRTRRRTSSRRPGALIVPPA